jgi:hypothetical protein
MKFLEAAKTKKYGSTHKLKSYYDAYEFHFGKLDREKKYNILEMGVQNGGGLWTLKEFFPNSSITGLDINSSCKQHESKDDDIEIFIGSQSDINLLQQIHDQRGPFDIIIDDAGHHIEHQQISFSKLFPLMNNDSIYVIEDLHTSYWHNFNIKSDETMMDTLKNIASKSTSSWASRCRRAIGRWRNESELDYYDENVNSVHFHDSICFVYKKHCTDLKDKIENYKSVCIKL